MDEGGTDAADNQPVHFLESTVDNTEKGPGPKPEEKTACPCMLAASQTQNRLVRDAVGSSMSTGSQSSLPRFGGRAGMESSMAQGARRTEGLR